jgi:hypothetical protein
VEEEGELSKMRDRLQDPIWGFVSAWVALAAIFIAVVLHLDSIYDWRLLNKPIGCIILGILALPPVVFSIANLLPVPRVKTGLARWVEEVGAFFRSTWGKRVLALALLLLWMSLEYAKPGLGSQTWVAKLSTIILQSILLTLLIYQVCQLTLGSAIIPSQHIGNRMETVLTVDATSEDGLNTGIIVRARQRIMILADGEVSIDGGHQWTDPDGTFVRGESLGSKHRATNTYLDQKDGKGVVGALIAWIGEDRDASSFLVGKAFDNRVRRTGQLHLGVNDQRGAFADNTDLTGAHTSFSVTVIVH